MRRFKQRWSYAAGLAVALSVMITAVFPAGAAVGTDAFERTWMRTDKPVAEGQVSRTWMWGPIDTAFETTEVYAEAPDGERQVAYFDKSRMEINDPDAPQDTWYVTNGLLATELITGNMQMGDDTFEQHEPAQVNVAGDASDPTGPTYATFNGVLDVPAADEGATITQRIDRDGVVTDDPLLVEFGVLAGAFDDVTHHTVAQPFWDFMHSTGPVWEDDALTTGPLFESYLFATGRPITEAYWANVQVAGEYQDVLMQCFERRCLTYTPGNDEGWQVEAGNVGLHYHAWRYDDAGNGGEPQVPGDPAAGQLLFQQKACAACHSIDGSSSPAPALNGLLGSTVTLADDSTIVADREYIHESIADPGAKVVKGYVAMPNISLAEQEINDLVAYIMTLE